MGEATVFWFVFMCAHPRDVQIVKWWWFPTDCGIPYSPSGLSFKWSVWNVFVYVCICLCLYVSKWEHETKTRSLSVIWDPEKWLNNNQTRPNACMRKQCAWNCIVNSLVTVITTLRFTSLQSYVKTPRNYAKTFHIFDTVWKVYEYLVSVRKYSDNESSLNHGRAIMSTRTILQ